MDLLLKPTPWRPRAPTPKAQVARRSAENVEDVISLRGQNPIPTPPLHQYVASHHLYALASDQELGTAQLYAIVQALRDATGLAIPIRVRAAVVGMGATPCGPWTGGAAPRANLLQRHGHDDALQSAREAAARVRRVARRDCGRRRDGGGPLWRAFDGGQLWAAECLVDAGSVTTRSCAICRLLSVD